jgi:hypothetical protein
MICALVVIFSFGSALAQKVQPPVDVMKVDYFDNANRLASQCLAIKLGSISGECTCGTGD